MFFLTSNHAILFIVSSFLILILLSTIFFKLPIILLSGQSISFVDALFNSTSSVCGIGTMTIPYDSLSIFGKIGMIIIIQIGSIGLITIIISIAIIFIKKGIVWYSIANELFDTSEFNKINLIIKLIFYVTLSSELFGAIFYKIYALINNIPLSFLDANFISINMFCNAGFLVSKSIQLILFQSSFYYLISSILMLIGGLGFIFAFEIFQYIKSKKLFTFSFTVKIILLIYGLTILISFMLLFFFIEKEWSVLSFTRALFASISLRSCGIMPYSNISFIFALMTSLYGIIGTAPLGTGDGLKSSFVAIILFTPISMLKKYNNIVIMNRSISQKKVLYAHCVLIYKLFLSLFMAIFLFSRKTNLNFANCLADLIGITLGLGFLSGINYFEIEEKYILIASIILGKLLTLIFGLSASSSENTSKNIIYPNEKIMVI